MIKYKNFIQALEEKPKTKSVDNYTHNAVWNGEYNEDGSKKIVFEDVLTQETIEESNLEHDILTTLNEPYHDKELDKLQHNDYTDLQQAGSFANAVNYTRELKKYNEQKVQDIMQAQENNKNKVEYDENFIKKLAKEIRGDKTNE